VATDKAAGVPGGLAMRTNGPIGKRGPERIARDAHPPVNERWWGAVGQAADPRLLQQSRARTVKRCTGRTDHPRDAARRRLSLNPS
jgi:hypothetical protein